MLDMLTVVFLMKQAGRGRTYALPNVNHIYLEQPLLPGMMALIGDHPRNGIS
jgi:hypothetical protein